MRNGREARAGRTSRIDTVRNAGNSSDSGGVLSGCFQSQRRLGWFQQVERVRRDRATIELLPPWCGSGFVRFGPPLIDEPSREFPGWSSIPSRPAARMGLVVGDFITTINGTAVDSYRQVAVFFEETRDDPEYKIEMTVWNPHTRRTSTIRAILNED